MLFSAPAVADETFPQPPELQPDVDFWVDIFTRYTTNQGVLHDTRNVCADLCDPDCVLGQEARRGFVLDRLLAHNQTTERSNTKNHLDQGTVIAPV